jgi:hypothetical protein
MIAIGAVRPNVILDRQHRFSPQIEPYIFFCGQNMTYCNAKHPFSVAFQFHAKEIFTKAKTTSTNFLSKRPPIGVKGR